MARPFLRPLTIVAIGCALVAAEVLVASHASGEHASRGVGVLDTRPGSAQRLRDEGRQIFRFDTFGDEQLWTDVLRMHTVISGVSPAIALNKGLKVDVDALPPAIVEQLKANQVDLNDPAITVALIGMNAVVGVRGTASGNQLTSLGITCALCHSTVDDSLADGIGKRLDGWANTDLDVGAIVALSPALDPATQAVFNAWGPGMYDPRHHAFNGKAIMTLNTPSLPVVIPAIYGLKGTLLETYTGDGPISYWNSYVGVSQMGGQGNFFDLRIGLKIRQVPDLVTPKLPALLAYQLSLQTPPPPPNTFDAAAAERGKSVFRGAAGCDRCHDKPGFFDLLRGRSVPILHKAEATGMEPIYASRSATGKYRATPLRGLWQHPPYFHDGSAPDLKSVVDHYDGYLGLNLNPQQKDDLVQYLKSL